MLELCKNICSSHIDEHLVEKTGVCIGDVKNSHYDGEEISLSRSKKVQKQQLSNKSQNGSDN